MLLSGCTGTSRGETLAVVFVTYRQPYDFLYSLSLSLSLFWFEGGDGKTQKRKKL